MRGCPEVLFLSFQEENSSSALPSLWCKRGAGVIHEFVGCWTWRVWSPSRRHDSSDSGVLPLPPGRCLPHYHTSPARTESDPLSDAVEHVVSVITPLTHDTSLFAGRKISSSFYCESVTAQTHKCMLVNVESICVCCTAMTSGCVSFCLFTSEHTSLLIFVLSGPSGWWFSWLCWFNTSPAGFVSSKKQQALETSTTGDSPLLLPSIVSCVHI